MGLPSDLYRPSLALLTDLYQLTMAHGYWKAGVADREAVFHLTFRSQPFHGGFAIACGLEHALDFIEHLRFDESDLAYLATLPGGDGTPLFDREYLERLAGLRMRLDVDAIPEGTAVFPHEPLLRVRGPIVECQLLETALLNLVNFQTLVATKAARVCLAAGGDAVLEFGLRRAQGIDGALTASRAAFVGGCESTSNVLAGKLYGIPVRGTHAHSWVMLFGDEREAFHEWARAMPNNSVFLVDTYETLDGVRHAIEAGRWLRSEGHRFLGIRLDSGDLAWLSIEARRLLDAAGFPDAHILASSDLDEHIIHSLKQQGARIAVWGVGTRLATAWDQPALGGVYKLSATREPGAPWQYRVKLSEQVAKISTPGILGVRRYQVGACFAADQIYDEVLGPGDAAAAPVLVDPADHTRRKTLAAGTPCEELLVPVMRAGQRVYTSPPLGAIRRRSLDQLARLDPTIKRLLNPHAYPVGLEPRLHQLRTRLIIEARQSRAPGAAEGGH